MNGALLERPELLINLIQIYAAQTYARVYTKVQKSEKHIRSYRNRSVRFSRHYNSVH